MNESERAITNSLKIAMNQCKCDFGESTFTKEHLLRLAEGEQDVLKNALDEWTRKRFIRWVKPWEGTGPEEPLVEMVAYIDGRGPS